MNVLLTILWWLAAWFFVGLLAALIFVNLFKVKGGRP